MKMEKRVIFVKTGSKMNKSKIKNIVKLEIITIIHVNVEVLQYT